MTAARINGAMLNAITPLILTFDEIDNIERTVSKLGWAERILVIDSGSTDGTLEFLRGHARVDVVYRKFDTFAEQANFGLQHIKTEWVLSLDADYRLSDPLVDELSCLEPTEDIAGYSAPFAYCLGGRVLRGSLYPPRTVLYRPTEGRYVNEGHGHRIRLNGKVQPLRELIYHDDRKPLRRWFDSQQRYSAREADYLLNATPAELGRTDRLRRMAWPAPILVVFYVLIVKRCALDGWAGWFYALQRLVAEMMIAMQIIDKKFSRQSSN